MSGDFLIVPYKPKAQKDDKSGLKAKCLDQIKKAFDADNGQHTFKVILLRAPAQSHLEAGVHFPKVTEAALKAKESVEGLEVYDVTIQPEFGIVASQMNIPAASPGK